MSARELYVSWAPPAGYCTWQGGFCQGLTLKTDHCVCSTVIHGCVLSFKIVHLQVGYALGIISGDDESVLHWISIICCIIITFSSYASNPLKPLPRSLADPVYGSASEGESRGCTAELQWPLRLHQSSPRLNELHLTMDTCKQRESWSRNCHKSLLYFSLTSAQTISIPCYLPFKRTTKMMQFSPNPMLIVLFAVLISKWEDRARVLCLTCRGRVGLVFMSRGRPYLHILLHILCADLWSFGTAVNSANVWKKWSSKISMISSKYCLYYICNKT